MSGAHEQNKKRRPCKVFLIATDLKVQDQLEGTIRLQRGFLCQEQEPGKTRGDCLWVKVSFTCDGVLKYVVWLYVNVLFDGMRDKVQFYNTRPQNYRSLICLSSVFSQVLDNGLMVKIERKFLLEVASDLSGLLEPVPDPETRLKLLSNAHMVVEVAVIAHRAR